MTRLFILIAILLSNLIYPQSLDKLEEIRNIYAKFGTQEGPAYAGAIIENDTVLYIGSFGKSNIDDNEKSTMVSTFQIGNLSQQFVVLGILLLEKDGVISQEDYLSKYLSLSDAF